MSQTGSLIVTSPRTVEHACEGWYRKRDKDRRLPRGRPYPEAAELLGRAHPFSWPFTWPRASYGELKNLLYHSYPDGEDFPVYLYKLDDEFADRLLTDWPEANGYSDGEVRRAAGLRVYWFLESY